MIKPLLSRTILFSLVIICTTILTFKGILTPENFLLIILPVLSFKAGNWDERSKKETS